MSRHFGFVSLARLWETTLEAARRRPLLTIRKRYFLITSCHIFSLRTFFSTMFRTLRPNTFTDLKTGLRSMKVTTQNMNLWSKWNWINIGYSSWTWVSLGISVHLKTDVRSQVNMMYIEVYLNCCRIIDQIPKHATKISGMTLTGGSEELRWMHLWVKQVLSSLPLPLESYSGFSGPELSWSDISADSYFFICAHYG